MKRYLLLVVTLFVSLHVHAAPVATTATQTIARAATAEAVPVESTVVDARQIARAFLSHDSTVICVGNFYWQSQRLDGQKVDIQGDYRTQPFRQGQRIVWKYVSIRVNGKERVVNPANPPDVFPYDQLGIPTNFWMSCGGLDAKGNTTRYGECRFDTWQKGQPFVFEMKPAYVSVVIKYDLAGRPASSVGLAVSGWGGSTLSYVPEAGGFVVWLDPLQTYEATVVDRTTGAILLPLPPIKPLDLPDQAIQPTGSAMSQKLTGNFDPPIVFDDNGVHSCGDSCEYSQPVIEGGVRYFAKVVIIEADQLQAGAVSVFTGGFFGRLEVIPYLNGKPQPAINWIANDYLGQFYCRIPAGYQRLIISFIHEPVAVSLPAGTDMQSPDGGAFSFSLLRELSPPIVPPVAGGKG